LKLAKTKQIVIDKSAFIAICFDALCEFAQKHLLIVPDVLCYECHTNFSVESQRTLNHCKEIICYGAHYSSCSTDFLQIEGSFLEPYPWFLPNLEITRLIRNDTSGVKVFDAKQIFDSRIGVARKIFVDAIARICKEVKPNLQVSPNKVLPVDKMERFVEFLNYIDSKKEEARDFVLRSMPNGWVKDNKRFCLSSEWVSWHYFRLIRVIALEYCYCGLSGGAIPELRAEHDYQDMEYVLLLSRADGLLTRDKGLITLAKAAFPEKHLFSCLDEVPSDYQC
jgi:hypothetical protein